MSFTANALHAKHSVDLLSFYLGHIQHNHTHMQESTHACTQCRNIRPCLSVNRTVTLTMFDNTVWQISYISMRSWWSQYIFFCAWTSESERVHTNMSMQMCSGYSDACGHEFMICCDMIYVCVTVCQGYRTHCSKLESNWWATRITILESLSSCRSWTHDLLYNTKITFAIHKVC